MNQPIALIYNGVWSQKAFSEMPNYRDTYRLLYVKDLDQLSAYQAAVIPFQSNWRLLENHSGLLREFLGQGKFLAVFGDSRLEAFGAEWQDRPVDNYWWKNHPDRPPISWTDRDHPIYRNLEQRHACWHHHGVYTRIPEPAKIIQRSGNDEIVTWETNHLGGTLFVTTKDPVVEHGIRQIRHLDHYLGAFTNYALGKIAAQAGV